MRQGLVRRWDLLTYVHVHLNLTKRCEYLPCTTWNLYNNYCMPHGTVQDPTAPRSFLYEAFRFLVQGHIRRKHTKAYCMWWTTVHQTSWEDHPLFCFKIEVYVLYVEYVYYSIDWCHSSLVTAMRSFSFFPSLRLFVLLEWTLEGRRMPALPTQRARRTKIQDIKNKEQF
jgi:hypothetical protein